MGKVFPRQLTVTSLIMRGAQALEWRLSRKEAD